jgi:transposase-like protein
MLVLSEPLNCPYCQSDKTMINPSPEISGRLEIVKSGRCMDCLKQFVVKYVAYEVSKPE